MMLSINMFASPGDTTTINVYSRFHMDRYGFFNKWADFTNKPQSQRIFMDFTLGCLDNGQCEWDYTIKIFARERTGLIDSAQKNAPLVRINGLSNFDTLFYRLDTTFYSQFDSVQAKEKLIANNPTWVVFFRNLQNPNKATDSIQIWPSRFYQIKYDSLGNAVDSIWISESDTTIQKVQVYYEKFQVINDIEIGRFISPYAKTFPKSFKYQYLFDVTEYESLLKDSVEIRIKYEGYSYGFTASIDFYCIEGMPIRNISKVENVYSGGYAYGRSNNPIENFLKPYTFTVPNGIQSVRARVYISGHGAEQNENCAEFCAKNYYLKLDNKLIAQKLVWKNDCGSNAIINQPGTWIYNRANWCPGEKVPVYDYLLQVNPGSTHTIDLDMEPFVANGDALYNIALQLFYVSNENFTTDVSLEEIISPTTNFWHNRINPICDNAQVKVKNLGTTSVQSLRFRYNIGGGASTSHVWEGKILANEEMVITLPWLQWPSGGNDSTFFVEITDVNGAPDQNLLNNKNKSRFIPTTILPASFVIEVRTNNRPEQNSYTIKDSQGKEYFSRIFTESNTIYRDTFNFSVGCFTLDFKDDGGNGLSFWAQPNEGNGNMRILSADMPVRLLRSWNMDFGSYIKFNFTAQFPLHTEDIVMNDAQSISIYPSPASDFLYIESEKIYPIEYKVIEMSGRVYKRISDNMDNTKINISDIPSGIYLLQINGAGGEVIIKKFSVLR
jgi:hypothetical protein